MHDLKYYVLNRDKRARWHDDHIMGLAPRPLPKTSQQAFQQYFARGHALFLPDDSDRVLDALDLSAHDFPPQNWTVQFPPNCTKFNLSGWINTDIRLISFRGSTPIRQSDTRQLRNIHCTEAE